MTESLRQKQSRFAGMAARLILTAHEFGYDVTLGEALRSDEQAEINALGSSGRAELCRTLEQHGYTMLAAKIRNNAGSGIRGSLHELKLAIDLQLFCGGVYLTKSEDYRLLGEWWESIGGTWGGRFVDKQGAPKPDGNHFSLEHQGRK